LPEPSSVQQILINLLLNAVAFTERRDHPSVAAQRTKPLVFRVRE